MYLPLSQKGQMSNSIARFVLNHPEITDCLEAYNQWVRHEQFRDFPLGQSETVSFCLEIFNTCINFLTREQLEEILYNEDKFLILSSQSLDK